MSGEKARIFIGRTWKVKQFKWHSGSLSNETLARKKMNCYVVCLCLFGYCRCWCCYRGCCWCCWSGNLSRLFYRHTVYVQHRYGLHRVAYNTVSDELLQCVKCMFIGLMVYGANITIHTHTMYIVYTQLHARAHTYALAFAFAIRKLAPISDMQWNTQSCCMAKPMRFVTIFSYFVGLHRSIITTRANTHTHTEWVAAVASLAEWQWVQQQQS